MPAHALTSAPKRNQKIHYGRTLVGLFSIAFRSLREIWTALNAMLFFTRIHIVRLSEKKMMRTLTVSFMVACLLVLAPLGFAEQPADAIPIPQADIPPPPDSVESGEAIEPEITIIQREDMSVEEYRVNGRLYMVKIVPIVGKPYYLVDNDGDGLMESRMSDIYNVPIVPQWVIFSW